MIRWLGTALRAAFGGWSMVWMAAVASPALAQDAAGAPPSDPAAVKVADRVLASLGGEKAWNDLHYLSFTFQVSINDTLRPGRRHWWDKWSGWHRVEGKTGAGLSYCLIDNVNTHEGMAWMNGNAIEGDSLKKLLTRAHALWVNDTYWLCMPFKLQDPGVTLTLDGDRQEGDQAWDKLSLTFHNVGLTPGDHYWLHVNRKTGRIDRWEMVLQGSQPPPEAYEWSDWKQVGGVWFSGRRAQGNRAILLSQITAPAALPEGAFTSSVPLP